MKVKFLDLQKNYQALENELLLGIQKNVLNTNQYISGPSVKKFEENFANYLGVRYCVGVGNGTDALEIALKAIGIGKNDEVITQNNTFASTCLAVTSNQGKLIIVDNREDDYTINTDQIEAKITSKTKAIIPVHLYGHCADMDKILDIAYRHNLYVIEDTAQAHGALYKGKRAGTIGDIGCFSFYPGKNLGAYGDGGAIVTNNKDLFEKVKLIHNLGSKTKYHHELVGRNSRLDSIQAEILNIKLKYLDSWNEQRRKNALLYDRMLEGVGDIRVIQCNSYCQPVYHLYVVRTQKRDELRSYLKNKGIDTGIHYPIPINKLLVYENKALGIYPLSEKYANEILSLPMFPELTEKEIIYVYECIKDFYQKCTPQKIY